jgi:hypothetical protein
MKRECLGVFPHRVLLFSAKLLLFQASCSRALKQVQCRGIATGEGAKAQKIVLKSRADAGSGPHNYGA